MVVPIRISAKSEAAHVPGKFNVRRKSEGFGGFQDCAVNALIDWVFACGGTDKGDYINMVLKLKECAQQYLEGGGGLTFNPEVAEVYGNILSSQFEAKASGGGHGGVFKSVTDCNPCDRDFMACSTKGMRCLYNSMPKATPDIKDLGKGKIMRIKNAVDNYNEVKGFADEVQNMVNADCDHCDFSSCVSNPGFSDFPSSMAGEGFGRHFQEESECRRKYSSRWSRGLVQVRPVGIFHNQETARLHEQPCLGLVAWQYDEGSIDPPL